MGKILVICCSDMLGVPAIMRLLQQNMLAAVACNDKSAYQLLPIFKSLGIPDSDIHILTKQGLEPQFKALVGKYQPSAIFAVTFSWLVPDSILALLPNRCINFHFGILPKYKGADPVFWQLRNGEQLGGISIHVMTGEIDAGPVIAIEHLPIMPGETYGINIQRLGVLAADAVTKVLAMLGADTLPTIALPDEPALYFKKPTQSDLQINWQNQSAADIEHLVNAANPRYQGAITRIRQMQVNLLEVAPADVNNPDGQQFAPGTIIHADLLYGIIVACINNQYLKINVAQIQEGYFSGSKLFSLGFKVGEAFG